MKPCRILALSAVLGSALAFAACSSGGGKSGPPGGIVQFNYVLSTVLVNGTFVSSVEPEDAFGVLADPRRDTCDPIASATATPSPTASPAILYLDVGPTITLESGAQVIAMDRTQNGSVISYAPAANPPASPEMFGTSYDVILSGSTEVSARTWAGALKVPEELLVTTPPITAQVTIPAGADFDLVWSPAGADYVIVTLAGFTVTRVCYPKDDGAFTVPAEVIDSLDANGLITFTAVSERSKKLDGREVELIGRTTVGNLFSKN